MAIWSGFFDANLIGSDYDRVYLAREFAKYFGSLVANGVFDLDDNTKVMATSGMVVDVLSGKAWINGYMFENDDNYSITLDPADGLLNRYDRIVLRLDLGSRQITIEKLSSVVAASPVPPVITRSGDIWELSIGTIYIGAGVTAITQANITDDRPDATICGKVRNILEDEGDGRVPPGGLVDEALVKLSSADWDTAWRKIITLPQGGIAGDVLTKNTPNDGDASWKTPGGAGSNLAILNNQGEVIQHPAVSTLTNARFATINAISPHTGVCYGCNIGGIVLLCGKITVKMPLYSDPVKWIKICDLPTNFKPVSIVYLSIVTTMSNDANNSSAGAWTTKPFPIYHQYNSEIDANGIRFWSNVSEGVMSGVSADFMINATYVAGS